LPDVHAVHAKRTNMGPLGSGRVDRGYPFSKVGRAADPPAASVRSQVRGLGEGLFGRAPCFTCDRFPL